MAVTEEELREAAAHRGLKLIKSRRRKPGVGDYGLFGLADSGGKPLFGMSEEGLTATSDQIVEFLRKGEVSTWAASAKSVPDRPKTSTKNEPGTSEDEDEDIPSAIRPRRRRSAARSAMSRGGDGSDETSTKGKGRPRPEERGDRAHSTSSTVSQSDPSARHDREAEPASELSLRSARPKDAEALQRLLGPLDDNVGLAGIRRAVSSAAARKEPVLVAEKGALIGCLAWHAIPGLVKGDTARITVIFVAEDERRQGVGRALYEHAQQELRRLGISSVEAMSEIEVRNANGFFRAIGLKQSSYRFATDL